jgi:hypothetical protein
VADRGTIAEVGTAAGTLASVTWQRAGRPAHDQLFGLVPADDGPRRIRTCALSNQV